MINMTLQPAKFGVGSRRGAPKHNCEKMIAIKSPTWCERNIKVPTKVEILKIYGTILHSLNTMLLCLHLIPKLAQRTIF